MLTVKPLCQQF
ncbi:hypothetical protein PENPOL_c032G07670 [Penicillium polonicum]|uniref:Uncharacterized protein n=1 Tax=Penicillium polonicum TaxID=60169 RepID=A0A1V6N609_PENPO|nr:hypothetical protein PENPOL_c032G07670 [Penicillium polonicum]